jgi:hypothetical protein
MVLDAVRRRAIFASFLMPELTMSPAVAIRVWGIAQNDVEEHRF